MTISAGARQTVYAAQTGEAFLNLLTVDHVSFPAPVRLVNDGVDLTSRGDLFSAYPFEIAFPADREGAPPRTQLVIDNVGEVLISLIRNATSPISVTLETVAASTPDTVEVSAPGMTMKEVRYNALAISVDLAFEDILGEPYPFVTFTPGRFPALFR